MKYYFHCLDRGAAFSPLANSPPAISPAANGPPAKSPPGGDSPTPTLYANCILTYHYHRCCVARSPLTFEVVDSSSIVSASSRIRFLPVQAQPTAARSSRGRVAHGRHIGRYFYLIILPLLIVLLSLKSNFIIL